jgi:peptidoglycan/LPS O-acetylase OafA/YrhL
LIPALDTLLQHLLFINSLNYSNMFLNISHFWYLGLLAQFYLIFPFALGLFLRIGAARAALWIIAVCWGSWMILAWYFPTTDAAYPGMAENLMHFNLPGRLPEFAIGMWLASLWNPSGVPIRVPVLKRSFSLFAAAMVIYIIAGTPFSSDMSLPLIHICHVAISGVLSLILLVWPPVARAGKSAFLKAIAEQSYAIYIVHHPLFSYIGVMPFD